MTVIAKFPSVACSCEGGSSKVGITRNKDGGNDVGMSAGALDITYRYTCYTVTYGCT